MNHTPGPWILTVPNGTNDPWVKYSICTPIMRIADVQDLGRPEETDANAHLLVSAPALLAALEKVLDWTKAPGSRPDPEVVRKIVEPAVAKAIGN